LIHSEKKYSSLDLVDIIYQILSALDGLKMKKKKNQENNHSQNI